MSSLRDHTNIVVITGAGISAASGIPTYRDDSSGWRNARLEELSHASRYGNHLDELWTTFWSKLRTAMVAAQPNDAHLALARLEERVSAQGGSVLIATQNIDGLHQRAGNSDVVELHGSMLRSRCLRPRCGGPYPDLTVPEDGLPRCPNCDKVARPDVVLFGEQLSAKAVRRVKDALRRCDLCLYVGTSGEVWPVSDLVTVARGGGARCVLVNRDQWRHRHPDFHETHLGPAEELLADLFDC